MADKKLIGVNLTYAQVEAFTQALGGVNRSDVLRGMIAEYCASKGVEFPDDMPTHGGRRIPKDVQAELDRLKGE